VKRTTDAVEILHHLYFEWDSEMMEMLEEERAKASIAQQIYDLRTEAGLTQKQLAEQVGVTEDVICDLEDTDCEGDAFLMLRRIAKALNKQVFFRIAPLEVGNV